MDQAGDDPDPLASGAQMTSAAARVGREIRRRRSELRLSQERLALRAGVSLATLGALERAHKRTYTAPILAGVDTALGWEVGHLQAMFDEGPRPDGPPAAPDSGDVLAVLAEYRQVLDELRATAPDWHTEWLRLGESLGAGGRAAVAALVERIRR